MMISSILGKHHLTRLAPVAVLLLGLSITFIAWNSTLQDLREAQQERFEFRVNEIAAAITERLKSYEEVLLGTSGLFAASESVERGEFRNYVERLKLDQTFPGIQGVGFSLRVPPALRERHIRQIRQEGFPHYDLHPQGERDTYSAIVYLEPFDWRNQRAFGYDMYADAVRRAAMDAAWLDGETAISGKVKLIQETEKDAQWGFLMYVPVYRNGKPVNEIVERRANLHGWAYSAFRMNDFMKGILGKKYGEVQSAMDLKIFDGPELSPARLMYESNPGSTAEQAKEASHAIRKIEFGHHIWMLAVHSLRDSEMLEAKQRIRGTAYAGVAISLLMAFTVWLLIGGRESALALAERMTVQLQTTTRLQRAILDGANYIIISTDASGLIRTFNAAAERQLGYQANEVIGKTSPTLIHDTQEIARRAASLSHELGHPVEPGFDAFIAKARSGVVDENEWTYIRKDGSRFPVSLSVTALSGAEGEITGYLGIAQNIEESKRAQKQLQKLSRAIEQSPESVLITDTNGTIEYVNPRLCQVSGYSADELIGQNPRVFKSGKQSQEVYGVLWSTILSGAEWNGELLNRKKNGELYWEHAVISALRNEHGEVSNFVGVKEDITVRKAAEREIRRFKNILDNTLDMIFMFEPETLRLVYLNKGAVASLGYTREELMGRPVWEIKPRMPEPVFRAHISPLLKGERPWLNYETVHLRKDGTELPVEVFLQLIEEEDGKRLFVTISRDLSERRRIDMMKSEFISTVSHELRTPLTSILGSLGLVRGRMMDELPSQAKPMIEIAYNNSERLVRLINDILDMEKVESGKMHFEMKTIKLMRAIEHAVEANQGYAERYKVRFVLKEVVAGARVHADADRLAQVMANLLSNAAKFSPPESVVTVSVRRKAAMLRVEVTDQGRGIPEEFRSRIFHKFSQADSSDTKQKGGTGLGLSICKAMIERMGGRIGYETGSPVGTTFFFELPEWTEDMAPPGQPATT